MTTNHRVKEKVKLASSVQRLALSLSEVEQRIGVSRYTLRRMTIAGTLKAVRFGRRIVIPAAELEKVLTAKKVGGPNKLRRRARPLAPAEV
jgi:excisionase family DNA binding protein